MKALFVCGVSVALMACFALEGGAISCGLASVIAFPAMAVASVGYMKSDLR